MRKGVLITRPTKFDNGKNDTEWASGANFDLHFLGNSPAILLDEQRCCLRVPGLFLIKTSSEKANPVAFLHLRAGMQKFRSSPPYGIFCAAKKIVF